MADPSELSLPDRLTFLRGSYIESVIEQEVLLDALLASRHAREALMDAGIDADIVKTVKPYRKVNQLLPVLLDYFRPDFDTSAVPKYLDRAREYRNDLAHSAKVAFWDGTPTTAVEYKIRRARSPNGARAEVTFADLDPDTIEGRRDTVDMLSAYLMNLDTVEPGVQLADLEDRLFRQAIELGEEWFPDPPPVVAVGVGR